VRTLKLFQVVSVFRFSVLFHECADIWNKTNILFAEHRQHCLTAVLYFRCPHIPETKHWNSFRIVSASLFACWKYANAIETVSVFYFSFISLCATGFSRHRWRDCHSACSELSLWNALTSLSLYPNSNFHAVPSSANVSLPVSSRFAETRFAEIRVRV